MKRNIHSAAVSECGHLIYGVGLILLLHGDPVRGDLHHRRLQLPHDQVDRAHLAHHQVHAFSCTWVSNG